MSTIPKSPSKQARHGRRKRIEAAEIGEPPLTDEQRAAGLLLREACRDDLEAFNANCFPNSTGLKPFGEVQRQSIAHDQAVIMKGGRICKAEPRGYGKTTRSGNAALWAVLYGQRRMVPVFSANLEKSKTQIIGRWKTELLSNDQLFWMFPELIWPLRALEGIHQRTDTQTFRGELTRTRWTADRIVLPTVEGVPGAGSVLIALPLKSCRGATHTMPDGTVLRPDLIIFDDVQRDEDADNPNTTKKIEDLIDHSAMMLGGHSQTMSAIMNCTVRRLDDLSEQYLKKPGWRRVRYKCLTTPAKAEKEFWLGEYARVRLAYDPESPDDQERAQRESLALYLSNREMADEGAQVTWDWAYAWNDAEPLEVSAIQHAYNILIDNTESVFQSEMQNEPLKESGNLQILTVDEICRKQSAYARRQFSADCTLLSFFIDVHPSILYWNVWAWQPGMIGYLVDYGTFPDQRRGYFSHTILSRTLQRMFPGRDTSATIDAGLDGLLHGCDQENWPGLMQREWTRSDGVPMKVGSGLIDANGEEADAVKAAIRRSPFSALILPSFGKGIGAKDRPISQWQTTSRQDGPEWRRTKGRPGEPPGLQFDVNYWKTRFHRALALPPGSQGAIYLPKTSNPADLRLIADHYRSEKPVEVTVGSRTVYEFGDPRPGSDNHFFDCAVGAMVAASKAGIRSVARKSPKPNKTLAELAAEAGGNSYRR